ncbi:hypothetical protein BDQ12DRAFT_772993 [Crucibulum laeve]|uniref:Uncharacterized protein n=1 Tax=Crucibulum laeve TaxID=68775 RepID=A0A5C3LIQ2_9AGAR|nr:hypothetical protein BDQ12DRAFT_772993 [Crucibulum laeve]
MDADIAPPVAPITDPLPSYEKLVMKVQIQEEELETLCFKLQSFDAHKDVLNDMRVEISGLRQENSYLESKVRRLREEGVRVHDGPLNASTVKPSELRRELRDSVAEVLHLERVLTLWDAKLKDFVDFVDFQHCFEYCAYQHFAGNHKAMDKGFADGLGETLESISQMQEEYFLPMGNGGAPLLEDCL